MIAKLAFFLLFCLSVRAQESKKLPDEVTYAADTKLMYDICSKFSEETDIKRLRSVAQSTMTIRLIPCTDLYGECKQYLSFLRTVLEITKNGDLSAKDRIHLREKLAELKHTIDLGKNKLHAELSKK